MVASMMVVNEMADPPVDKVLEKKKAQLAALQADLRNVVKVTSMSIFTSDAAQRKAVTCISEGTKGKTKKKSVSGAFYGAHEQFQECQPDQLDTLWARALKEREMRTAHIEAQLAHVHKDIELYLERKKVEKTMQKHRFMPEMNRFSQEEHDEIDAELASDRYHCVHLPKQLHKHMPGLFS